MNTKDGPIKCSDHQVIDELYSKMGKPLMAKAYSILGNQSLAGEVVQDCFLKLWQRGEEFPAAKACYSWLYKVCHNQCIDMLRGGRSKYEASFPANSEGEAMEFGLPAETEEQLNSRDILRKLCGALPERDSEILVYTHVDGMTQQATAELLNVSRKTIQRSIDSTREAAFKILAGGEL